MEKTYEQRRLENIRKNEEIFNSIIEPKPKKLVVKKRPAPVEEVKRYSKRLRVPGIKIKEEIEEKKEIPLEFNAEKENIWGEENIPKRDLEDAKIKGISISKITHVALSRICEIEYVPGDELLAAITDKLGSLSLLGEKVATYKPHSQPAYGLKFLNNKQLVTGSYDGRITLFDLQKVNFKTLCSLKEEISWVTSSNQLVYFSTLSGNYGRLDTRDEKTKLTQCHDYKIGTVSVMDSYLITASNDKLIRVTDLRMNKVVSEFQHQFSCQSAFFSSSGQVLSTSYDNTIQMFSNHELKNPVSFNHNNRTGKWVTTFKAKWHPFIPNCFVVGNMTRKVDVYDGKMYSISDPALEVVPAVIALHRSHMLCGAANGKCYLFE